MASAQHIVTLGPTAVELVDRTMVELALANPAFQPTMQTALIGRPRPSCWWSLPATTKACCWRSCKRLVELMGDLGLPGSVVEMPDEAPQKACGRCARPA
jgi:hypothetical protein